MTAIDLFDSRGRRQGSLIALDQHPKALDEKQEHAIARITRLAAMHIEAGAIEELNQRLRTRNNEVDLLSEVARQINNGVVITDERGFVTWINHGFEKISGYKLHEMLGKRPGELLQGEQTDPDIVTYMGDQLAKRQSFSVEMINYHRSGTPYWIRIQCQPFEPRSGARKGFIAIQTDISAEKANQEKFENSLRLNHTILETLHDAVVTTDINGRIRTVNPALEELFGYPEDTLIGQSIEKLMPADVADHHGSHMKAYSDGLAGSGKIMGNARNLHGIRSDGSQFPLRIAVTETTVDSERLLVAAIHDITESEEAKAGLQRFRQTLDGTLDCVFMFDAQNLQFFYVNRGAIDQLGYSRKELMRMHPFDIKPDYPEDKFRELISPLVSGEVPRLSFQTLHRHKDGHAIPVDVALQYMTLEGEPPRFVAIVRDISEQHRHREEVEQLAYFDPLTNLPNRRLIRQRLAESMRTCSESGCFGAVLLSDLDDFKNINDTLGHRHGDDFLVEVSSRFLEVLGENTSLSRLGGDEFLVVLDTAEQDRSSAIRKVSETARQLLNAAYHASETIGGAQPVSTSIGIVFYNNASNSTAELMRMADIAMYDAKRKGKNNFSIFDEVMERNLLEEHTLTGDLSVALGRDDEILPWFQPKIDREGQITGFEALVRWNHPERGLLNPGQFIDLAERKNLIVPMSDHVLHQACQRMSAWRQQFAIDDWTISVNISQSQLAMRDFPQKIEQVLNKTGLPARALILEITETVVAENILHSIRQMELVRQLGVRFSLDDFGTGYSSMSYLRQLPIDELKIDKTFVDSILHDEEGNAIVKAILDLSHSLKLSVVAEGIEEEAQWEALKALGCEGFQGYFFSRPQPSEIILEMLNRERR
ncbi:sensor domain-containing protein [Marinobacter halotolerans]|uniref:sensor domain-containing protein n=1 Tax=Marinobacter halotolerans TaxID=1569211 RepID=UPI00177CA1CF|nr:EAL domain-containing protein [Marinobacter halotolerans]